MLGKTFYKELGKKMYLSLGGWYRSMYLLGEMVKNALGEIVVGEIALGEIP
jgi:hypothetical protein